jgi:hypothetical protein
MTPSIAATGNLTGRSLTDMLRLSVFPEELSSLPAGSKDTASDAVDSALSASPTGPSDNLSSLPTAINNPASDAVARVPSASQTDLFEDLIKRLQAPPPELFGKISDYVFLTTGPDPVILAKGYKMPATLQVSRETRQQAATAYYQHNIFSFDSYGRIKQCVKSLLPEHRALIREIHYDTGTRMSPEGDPAHVASEVSQYGRMFALYRYFLWTHVLSPLGVGTSCVLKVGFISPQSPRA